MVDRHLNPRPLGFHVMAATMAWNAAAASLPAFLGGAPTTHDRLLREADALRERLRTRTPDIYGQVTDAAIGRIRDMLDGVSAYHRHPYRRQPSDWPEIDTNGSLRILDCGPDLPAGAPTVVIVPSLINPSYILDLMPTRSLVRHLAAAGLRPLLLDWGEPGAAERLFTLTDYVVERVEPAIARAAEMAGRPVKLLGYCMGGNLALAATVRHPEPVDRLALLATPWDFHADTAPLGRAVAAMLVRMTETLPVRDTVPVDLLQLFFSSLDPTLVDRKFRRFGRLDPNSQDAELFVAIEDWANDGMPLSRPVAQECLGDWYGDNQPAREQWLIGGKPIIPQSIRQPVLVVVPHSDRIVPPASALALADSIPQARQLRAPGGHVTMLVGPKSRNGLWHPLVSWLQ